MGWMTVRRAGAVVAGFAALSSSGAWAQTPRSVFCVAVRTVPMLDQNNYVMGATGPVYMTPNFTTSLDDDALIGAWKAFITARHPVAYPDNPDDTCQPANTRRALISAQRGDIRNRSISWAGN
jgi:hypothetical protein